MTKYAVALTYQTVPEHDTVVHRKNMTQYYKEDVLVFSSGLELTIVNAKDGKTAIDKATKLFFPKDHVAVNMIAKEVLGP